MTTTGMAGTLGRGVAAALVTFGGLVAAAALLGASGWSWLVLVPVGLLAGSIAGRASGAWFALAGLATFEAAAIALDLPRDAGPFWYLAAAGRGLLLVISALLGTNVGWLRSPATATGTSWRVMRPWSRRGLIAAVLLGLVGSAGYVGYAAWSGSAQFTEAAVTTADCRTPADRFGWTYDPINYDRAEEARLTSSNPDKAACTVFGPKAGAEVMTSDGIRLAGWYVPAASGVGPTGPTLLIVHGWKSSKSGALDFAPAFHQEYNLVLFDLRNNGQSTGTQTSMGLYERRDVTRMLDWVAAQKHPSWIGIVANSMGASAALGAAVDDQRVQALILDSVHADWATSVGNAMEEDFGVPGGVAGTALIGGVSLRVGGDVTEVDPVRLIPRLGERPVLLIQGTADQVDPPSEASERNFHAGLDAGVPIEIAYCEGARHGLSVRVCPTDWAAWAVSFLTRARAAG